jgi:hypothetical protein
MPNQLVELRDDFNGVMNRRRRRRRERRGRRQARLRRLTFGLLGR